MNERKRDVREIPFADLLELFYKDTNQRMNDEHDDEKEV